MYSSLTTKFGKLLDAPLLVIGNWNVPDLNENCYIDKVIMAQKSRLCSKSFLSQVAYRNLANSKFAEALYNRCLLDPYDE